jgi:hypothetical protein
MHRLHCAEENEAVGEFPRLNRSGQDAYRDGQVETPACFWKIRRGEVDANTPGRKIESRAEERPAHSVLAFAYHGSQ